MKKFLIIIIINIKMCALECQNTVKAGCVFVSELIYAGICTSSGFLSCVPGFIIVGQVSDVVCFETSDYFCSSSNIEIMNTFGEEYSLCFYPDRYVNDGSWEDFAYDSEELYNSIERMVKSSKKECITIESPEDISIAVSIAENDPSDAFEFSY